VPVVCAFAAACGCTHPVAEALPDEVDGWRREKIEPVHVDRLAPAIRERSPQQAVRARYVDHVPVTVLLVRTKTEAGAFALMQSWRHREGVQPFYRGNLFGYVEGADRETLIKFTRAFREKLPG